MHASVCVMMYMHLYIKPKDSPTQNPYQTAGPRLALLLRGARGARHLHVRRLRPVLGAVSSDFRASCRTTFTRG